MSCNLSYAYYYNACLTQSVTHLVTQRLHSAINTSYATTSSWHLVHVLGLWLMPQHCPSHRQCRCFLAWPFCCPLIYHKGTNLHSSLHRRFFSYCLRQVNNILARWHRLSTGFMPHANFPSSVQFLSGFALFYRLATHKTKRKISLSHTWTSTTQINPTTYSSYPLNTFVML